MTARASTECLRCGRRDARYLDGAPLALAGGGYERVRIIDCPVCGLRRRISRDDGPAVKRYVVRVVWTKGGQA